MTTVATPAVVLTGSDKINALGSVSGSVTVNLALGLAVSMSLSGDATITFSNWPSGWHSTATLYITSNGHAVTWPAEVTWSPGSPPTLTAGGATDVIVCSSLDGDPVFARTRAAELPGVPVTTQTASYTLVLADTGSWIRMNNASANNLTVPPQSDVVWLANTEIHIEQKGAGQTTVVAGAGVTIRTSETLNLAKQYAVATLKRVASDEWVLIGYLAVP